ncbi:MAG: IS1380 family transposase [Deltaproteobacteria bacterium]|nr:IS1380 family transposase [Deltaproteobacteria bacterium]
MMRKYYVTFSEKNLTGNAGLVHLGRFAEKLGIQKMLDKILTIQRGSTADYQVSDAVIMLMMSVLAGIKHMAHTVMVKNDEVLRAIFRWDKFPDATTFGRIFRLFSPSHCMELAEVENAARRKVWSKKWFGKITLDMDSTVRGVYGSQEGAEKGYNPKKKGQKSYHPLLCFVAENRECLHNWFRAGGAYSANGCVEFMKECFARLPKRVWQVIVRGDSAFFQGGLLDFLEEKGAQYMIKVKLRGLERLLESKEWRKVKNRPGFESAEFEFKCSDWEKARRFVAIREVITCEAEEDLLFDLSKVEYAYFCYVTNMGLSPMASHKYYGQRATSENWIEWCKNHMASGSILTQDFWANSAIFQTCIMAYNLMVWMMWLNDEAGFREEPNTIRMWLISVPAKLVTRSRRWQLKLSKNYPFKKRWTYLEESIQSLSFA